MIPYHDTTQKRAERKWKRIYYRKRNAELCDANKNDALDFRWDVEYILSNAPPRRHYVLK